ncbi:unnamed protein product, partial [Urochloa humidicola]
CRIVFYASGETSIKAPPRLHYAAVAMPSSSSGGSRRMKPAALLPPAPASVAERDWAALPGDILFAVFLLLGPREIMKGADGACSAWRRVAVG